MLEFEQLKLRLESSEGELRDLKDALGYEHLKNEIEELEAKTAAPGFWDDAESSQKILQKTGKLKNTVETYEKLCSSYDDLLVLIEMGDEEEDLSLVGEITENLEEFEKGLGALRLQTLLTGEYDNNNAILTFHAGAGGTEAMDWVSMLVRMYTRWSERHGFKVQLLDFLDGDEAGLKSAVMLIEGDNAYGYLKSESGVHRLVRVSPFDASGRRHTSFASLEVMPEIGDDNDIEIREEDIKMDVFRSSGAGGQHINKTSSAIRVTHIPTGTVVECQDERSQYKNKDKALKILRSRLLDAAQREHDEAIASDRKSQVGTGDRSERIRTYNYPQGRVTDHRIGLTLYKLEQILNGDMDEIIDALTTFYRTEALRAENGE